MRSKYSDELLNETIQYFEAHHNHKFSRYEAEEALNQLVEFVEILSRWEIEALTKKHKEALFNIRLKTIGQPFYFRFNHLTEY